MTQFIHDMIHMTEGEKLFNYWWLWLVLATVGFIAGIIHEAAKDRRKKR